MRKSAFLLSAICASLFAFGCSSKLDLKNWREANLSPRPLQERGGRREEIGRVGELRAGLKLAESRGLALSLAAEVPDDPEALLLASRAESDNVFLLPLDRKADRELSALHSLELARRAVALDGGSPARTAQMAWSLGTTTHLQSMFKRSGHARETLAAIEETLKKEPKNDVALATLSILRLRLATLPWIARVMAWGAPEGNIEEAVETARECSARIPSVEYRLIFAKALAAGGRAEDARQILEETLRSPDRFPRDAELRPEARKVLDSLSSKG